MSAPTAEEIREAIAANLDRLPVPGMCYELADIIGYVSTSVGDLWDREELRRSERERMGQAIEGHLDRIEAECREIIVRELSAAALEFAAEYPDAPRAKVEVSAA